MPESLKKYPQNYGIWRPTCNLLPPTPDVTGPQADGFIGIDGQAIQQLWDYNIIS